MKKKLHGIGCVFGLCMMMPTLIFAQMSTGGVQDSVLNMALWSVGLTQADLKVRGNTLADEDRLVVTKNLLEDPTRAVEQLPAFDRLTGQALLQDAFQILAGEPLPSDVLVVEQNEPPTLDTLLQALGHCQEQLDLIFADFSEEERQAFSSMIQLVDPGVSLSEDVSDSLLALGRRVDRVALVMATLDLMASVDAFVLATPMLEVGVFETPMGRVVVGGHTDDVYSGAVLLVIDLGGDDHYTHVANKLSLVIDLGGDDVHQGLVGCGIAGVNLVVDVKGQDRYVSEGMGQGVGVGGVGMLIDLAGDDAYQVGVGGQGFALCGVGILFDGDGTDRYAGDLLVQGIGAPLGVGMLADKMGDDVYQAGGKYRDFREEGAFYQSMAQGFGYGVRPLASGGVGVLVDGAGHDQYEVDYFGQGTGFWGSVGVLIDRGGNDRYRARRYAQGCGVHLAFGLLMDDDGDDVYNLWGVGQGCGHDLAIGRLIDRHGQDAYQATWLAQGVGNANGVGWLDDLQGDDLYVAERADSQGFGSFARDYGSIGLFIDRQGMDKYRLGSEQGWVRPSGDYGVGIDWPLFKMRGAR